MAVHGSTRMYIRLNRFTSVYTGVHPVKSSKSTCTDERTQANARTHLNNAEFYVPIVAYAGNEKILHNILLYLVRHI